MGKEEEKLKRRTRYETRGEERSLYNQPIPRKLCPRTDNISPSVRIDL